MYIEHGKEYTEDESILRAWDKECIHDLIGRFVLYWGNGQRRKALDELWVQTPDNMKTASFATNIGFFTGMNEIARHFVEDYEKLQHKVLESFVTANPGKYSGADLGMGLTSMHSCTTPVLFIADDGKTARYLGYDLGMSGFGKADGTADCYLEFSLLLIELIREDGVWKIWHLIEEHDYSIETGKDYNDVPTVISDPNDPSMKDFGTPTIPYDVYDNQWGWEYLYYDMPTAYRTYQEEEGYGPNGKVGKKFYERII